jgi:hypothetical protein
MIILYFAYIYVELKASAAASSCSGAGVDRLSITRSADKAMESPSIRNADFYATAGELAP